MNLRRLGKIAPWAAMAVALAVALFIGAHRSARPASLDARVRSIAGGIRCPTCEGQTVANSNVFAAKAIEADIAKRLTAGETPGQIRAYLVSRYGTSILESPPTHGLSGVIWILPIVAVPAAAAALVVGLRRSRSGPAQPVTDEDRALVAAHLQASPAVIDQEPTETPSGPDPVSPAKDLNSPPASPDTGGATADQQRSARPGPGPARRTHRPLAWTIHKRAGRRLVKSAKALAW